MTPREAVDKAVERLMRRSRKAVSATDVANRLDISQMAAMYALKRLRARGEILSSVIWIDTPTRLRTTVTVYQRPGLPSRWPAWLCPRTLPPITGRMLVERKW